MRKERDKSEMAKVLIMMRREREIRESQQREREVVRKERKIESDLKKNETDVVKRCIAFVDRELKKA